MSELPKIILKVAPRAFAAEHCSELLEAIDCARAELPEDCIGVMGHRAPGSWSSLREVIGAQQDWYLMLYPDRKPETLPKTFEGVHVDVFMQDFDYYFFSECQENDGPHDIGAIILRRNSLILLFSATEDDTTETGLIVLPEAPWHVTFDELEAIQRDFPGLMTVDLGG